MTEPVWLNKDMVIAVHEELIAEHGGLSVVRDLGLLESALARAQHSAAYSDPTIHKLAAAYGFGLARNHPFADGNKRTALAAIDLFLQFNGFELTAPEPEAVAVIQDLAAGTLDEAALAGWIELNVRPYNLYAD